MWEGEVLHKVRVTTYVAADRQYTSSIEVIAAHGFACDSAVNWAPLLTVIHSEPMAMFYHEYGDGNE